MIFKNQDKSPLFEQVIPIALAVVVFACLIVAVYFAITLINLLPTHSSISMKIRWSDILIGATIYFKTSVDFAILIAYLMKSNPGWKKRIAIEIGTAVGNGLGTIIVLGFWVVFKQLNFLLAAMILLSALVLFELAESGLKHFESWRFNFGIKRNLYNLIKDFLDPILKFTRPFTSKILPNFSKTLNTNTSLSWKNLLYFSLTTPFILGLDDFAGYIPLFSIINVFGFAIGVMAAHMILNIALFANPDVTIKWVKNTWVSFVGTLAFIGLALFGIFEAIKILI